MPDPERITVAITVDATVYMEDGKVTGFALDASSTGGLTIVSAEDSDTFREVDLDDVEEADIIAAVSGATVTLPAPEPEQPAAY